MILEGDKWVTFTGPNMACYYEHFKECLSKEARDFIVICYFLRSSFYVIDLNPVTRTLHLRTGICLTADILIK